MPLEVATSLASFSEQFPLVKICKNCLCNSVAYSQVKCNPDLCAIKLTEAVNWSKDDDPATMRRKFGGSCKAIARLYNKIDNEQSSAIDQNLFDMVWDLRNE